MNTCELKGGTPCAFDEECCIKANGPLTAVCQPRNMPCDGGWENQEGIKRVERVIVETIRLTIRLRYIQEIKLSQSIQDKSFEYMYIEQNQCQTIKKDIYVYNYSTSISIASTYNCLINLLNSGSARWIFLSRSASHTAHIRHSSSHSTHIGHATSATGTGHFLKDGHGNSL